jgi:hypothetical protein
VVCIHHRDLLEIYGRHAARLLDQTRKSSPAAISSAGKSAPMNMGVRAGIDDFLRVALEGCF